MSNSPINPVLDRHQDRRSVIGIFNKPFYIPHQTKEQRRREKRIMDRHNKKLWRQIKEAGIVFGKTN